MSTKNWALGSPIGVGLEKFCGIACSTTVPRGTVKISPSEALTPAGSPDSRSDLSLSGPDSRQCWPEAGTVPLAFAAASQAALPGAPNIQYWGVIREFWVLELSGCLDASVTAS